MNAALVASTAAQAAATAALVAVLLLRRAVDGGMLGSRGFRAWRRLVPLGWLLLAASLATGVGATATVAQTPVGTASLASGTVTAAAVLWSHRIPRRHFAAAADRGA